MAIKGPYTTQDEAYYQTRPKEYLKSQILDVTKKYALDSGRSEQTFVKLFKDNQNELNQATDTIFNSLKDQGAKFFGRDLSGAEMVDFINDISKWGVPIRLDNRGQDIMDVANLRDSVLSQIPQLIGDKALNVSNIEELQREYRNIGENLSPEEERRIFRRRFADKAESDIFLEKERNTIRERGIKKEVETIPQKESQAISELEKGLTGQQQRYFEQQALPAITQQLNVRGLLDTGSLATALAQEAGQGRERIEGITTPLRAQSRLGGIQRGFEQTLRGALESGRSLQDAINFARQISTDERQQAFESQQRGLGRQFEQSLFNQKAALNFALQPKGPSALDYYLQYGLQPSLDILKYAFGKAGGASKVRGPGFEYSPGSRSSVTV